MSQHLLEIKELKKYFPTNQGLLHAVDSISFTIKEGETLGLVGESGCGKSTTGRLLVRLLQATGGEILYKGENIAEFDRRRMKEFCKEAQMVFQDPFSSLDPRMSVSDIISEPLKVNRIFKRRKDLEDKVRELMEYAGIASRLVNSYPHELDGGRRQRVGIARALALNPTFLVLDEPVSALDVSIQAQILNIFEDLQDKLGLTYLFIAHDLSVVKHVSDEIAVMYMGKIVEYGNYERVIYEPLHPYTQALVSAIPRLNIHQKKERIILKGDVPSPVNPDPYCRFYGRCRERDSICQEEEVFLTPIKKDHYVSCLKRE